jgi:ribosomal protein S18 acetylase RimI-like enzyme
MVIRKATQDDRDALGRLGVLLMDVHFNFDRRRFLEPGANASAGYARYLVSQLDDPDSVIFVAEHEGTVVGYCYAVIEPMSWKELRDEAGFISDLALDPAARRRGAGRKLVDAAIEWFRDRKLARVMLWTSTQNSAAQELFLSAGFRPTMTEMTLDLE